MHLMERIHEGERIEVQCNCCEAMIAMTTGHRAAWPQTTCVKCVEKKKAIDKISLCKTWWEKRCPADYLDTDESHPEFPSRAWQWIRRIPLDRSLFIVGPTGFGKSRMACLRMKKLLWEEYQVRLAFPEHLKYPPVKWSTYDHLMALGSVKALLLDDVFRAGIAKDSVADFIGDLMDIRMRNKGITIVTSQMEGNEIVADSKKYGNQTRAEKLRVDAILRRLGSFEKVDCESFVESDDAGQVEAEF